MVLPGFVKEHPAISILGAFAVLGLLGFTAVNFTQGTFADGSGEPCTWQEAVNPETGNTFDSKEAFRNYFESNGQEIPDGLKLEYRDGVLHYRTPCGSVGGGGSTQ